MPVSSATLRRRLIPVAKARRARVFRRLFERIAAHPLTAAQLLDKERRKEWIEECQGGVAFDEDAFDKAAWDEYLSENGFNEEEWDYLVCG
jgi:hypothetical protein